MSGVAAMLAPAASLPATAGLDLGGEWLRMVLSLAGIIVLILLAGRFSRRLQTRGRPGGRRIRCVESMPLGPRERVLLLDVDGQRLLLGAGNGGVRLLHVLDGAAPADADAVPDEARSSSFADLLGRWKPRS